MNMEQSLYQVELHKTVLADCRDKFEKKEFLLLALKTELSYCRSRFCGGSDGKESA